MNNRTLVKATANAEYIESRTVSRGRKSPHQFCFLWAELASLEDGKVSICSDIHSFAAVCRNGDKLEMRFT